MSWSTFWLLCMCACYYCPISIVCEQQKGNNTLSSILCDSVIIFISIQLLCISTLFYEIIRYQLSSLFIVTLILGINGLLIYNETFIEHYIFSGIALISIYIFTIIHATEHRMCQLLLLPQTFLLGACLIEKYIISYEILYIGLFAFTYLYLHVYG